MNSVPEVLLIDVLWQVFPETLLLSDLSVLNGTSAFGAEKVDGDESIFVDVFCRLGEPLVQDEASVFGDVFVAGDVLVLVGLRLGDVSVLSVAGNGSV